MPPSVPMTAKGRANLEAKLKEFEARSPALVEALGAAREKGDLSENAEFDAAKEAIASLEASVNEVTNKLNHGQIVDIRRAPRGKVAFGATVSLLDLDTKKKEKYTLCGSGEEDGEKNWILTTSPLAQGLMLKKAGDEVEVEVPRGTVRYRVLKITYPK